MSRIDDYLKTVDEVIEKGRFKDNWESLSRFKTPSFLREGRFGIFIHWGVYSVPAFGNEWYPRRMYIKGDICNTHHMKKYGRDFEYRNFVAQFKPEKFDAGEWARLFKASGAAYIMPVGEHHDGIKMYQSSLNKWNMMELNGRDYMAELHAACDREGLGFMISNHRAEHYWFMNGARRYYPGSECARGLYPELYGPAYVPPSGNINKTDKEITASEEWLRDWLASACEMIDRNRPAAVYFDWWIQKSEFRPYVKKFLAYYYNRGEEWGREVCVFYKVGAVFDGCAVFDVERGQTDGALGKLWQNDTAAAKNSWGYTDGNKFKTAGEVIRNMIEVVAKNGCFMLNVGPKADGTVCREEKQLLLDIGKWLSVNGAAIRGSHPFEVCAFEGRKSKNGSFKENKTFRSGDYCFTAKPGKIFVFPMAEKLPQVLKIKSLRRANEGGIRYDVKSVRILGKDQKLPFEQSEKLFKITLPAKMNHETPICIEIDVD